MLLKILLITIAVILILWILRTLTSASYRNRGGGGRTRGPDRLAAEETQKCPTCGTYVAASRPQACGRADCRYPVRRSP